MASTTLSHRWLSEVEANLAKKLRRTRNVRYSFLGGSKPHALLFRRKVSSKSVLMGDVRFARIRFNKSWRFSV